MRKCLNASAYYLTQECAVEAGFAPLYSTCCVLSFGIAISISIFCTKIPPFPRAGHIWNLFTGYIKGPHKCFCEHFVVKFSIRNGLRHYPHSYDVMSVEVPVLHSPITLLHYYKKVWANAFESTNMCCW